MARYNFNKREKILLAVLVVMAVACIWYLAVFQNCQNMTREATTKAANLQIEAQAATTKAMQYKKMSSEIDKIRESGQQISQVPKYDNITNLTQFLNATLGGTESFNVEFADIESASDGIMKRSVNISFGCPTYESAKQILNALDASPYRCKFDTIDLSQGTGTSSKSILGSSRASSAATASAVKVECTMSFYEQAASE